MFTVAKRHLFGCVASASLALLVGIGGAGAATMSFLGGITGQQLPLNFSPNGTWPNADGVGIGSDIRIYTSASPAGHGLYVAPQMVTLTFELVGSDAGNTNSADSQFTWNNTALFTSKAALGTSDSALYNVGGNPGLLPFIFETDGASTNNAGATAPNGGPISASVKLAFSEIFGGAGTEWVYAFFEDSNGDNDFDDMIVKITAFSPPGGEENTVPLPPALILFGSALFGLTLLGRRRRASGRSDSVAAA